MSKSSMLAVFASAEPGKLDIRKVPVPVPGKGEVLVKILAAPVNPSDLAQLKTLSLSEKREISVLGIEGCGMVTACGKGLLPRLWLGKRVACTITHQYSGTWAEYMVTSASRCIPLPAEIPDEQGSMLLVNPLTALAFFNIIHNGRHKAIINTAAASALGSMIHQLEISGNIPVIHIVRTENLRKLLAGKGYKYVLNSEENDFDIKLKELALALNATIAFDATGGIMTRQLLRAIPYGGEVIVYGNLSGEQPQTDHRSLVSENKKVSGFYLANWLKDAGLFTTLNLILKARILLKRYFSIDIRGKFSLEQAQLAVETYLTGMTAGKVLLVPPSES